MLKGIDSVQTPEQISADRFASVDFWDPSGGDVGYNEIDRGGWSTWDIAYINGQEVPGMTQAWCSRKPRLTVRRRKAPGKDGEAPVLTGYEPAEITLNVHIWTADQLKALKDFKIQAKTSSDANAQTFETQLLRLPKLSKVGTNVELATLPAIDISHPALSLVGVTSMYIYTIGSPERHGSAQGVMVFRIIGYEQLGPQPKSALAKPQTPTPEPAALGVNTEVPQGRSAPTDPDNLAGHNTTNDQMPVSSDISRRGITPGNSPGTNRSATNP